MNIQNKHHRFILLIAGVITAMMISGLFFGMPMSCKTENEKARKFENTIISQSMPHLAHQKGQRLLSMIIRANYFK